MKIPFMFLIMSVVFIATILIAGEWLFCAYMIVCFYGEFDFAQTSGVWLNALGLQCCAWFLGRILTRMIKEFKGDEKNEKDETCD